MREQSELGVTSGTRGSSLTGLGRMVGSVNDRDSDPAPAEDSATHSGRLDDWLHSSMTDCSTQWRTPGSDQTLARRKISGSVGHKTRRAVKSAPTGTNKHISDVTDANLACFVLKRSSKTEWNSCFGHTS